MFKLKYIFSALVGLLLLILINYAAISLSTNQYIFSDINKTPNNKVGLVLGTSVQLRDGRINLYFKNRIDAASNLYFAEKIEYIVVSGDNSTEYYNEPDAMKAALIQRGVPESRIFTDYAGFNTLDSIIRVNKVFGQSSVTIISQKFQNQRAIFIARNNQIEAIGYNALDVSFKAGPRVYIREFLARVKATIEVKVLNKQPKFLGDPIQIY